MKNAADTLRTLNGYIEEGAGDHALKGLSWEIGRDRRFTSLLLISLVAHGLLGVLILRIDYLLFNRAVIEARRPAQLIRITELAPPPERFALRTRPEPIERVDLNRLQYDPNDADDKRLLSRSPQPSIKRGEGSRLPSPESIERRLREMTRARRAGTATVATGTRKPERPPATAQVQAGATAHVQPAPFADIPGPGATAPAAPAPSTPAPVAKDPKEVPPGSRRGAGSESTALGMVSAQGQYIAYVRAKILRINEVNMPRKWIEDLLRDKVSAQFDLTVRRDGRVASLQLVRTSGYKVLDGRAREAILLASPFEGFPQTAGDSLQFTVTVYYTPYR
jgi:outer membrane biosynthesis protein TonB